MPEPENTIVFDGLASTSEIRKRIADLQAQPESAERRVQIAALSCRLWTAIGHDYQKRAEDEEQREQRDQLLELAIRCDSQAATWAHEARQAKRLSKVDLLEEIKARLDGTEVVVARFHKLADRLDADRQLQTERLTTATTTLEAKNGQPPGVRGSQGD